MMMDETARESEFSFPTLSLSVGALLEGLTCAPAARNSTHSIGPKGLIVCAGMHLG